MQSNFAIDQLPSSGNSGADVERGISAQAKGNRSTVRILYAEDDALVRFTTELVLTRAGYTVTAVEDGLEAWSILQTETFDLLITDNTMPRLTGLELVARLRDASMEIPVIMASGSVIDMNDPPCDWLNITALLPKPFLQEELLKTVEHAVHQPAW